MTFSIYIPTIQRFWGHLFTISEFLSPYLFKHQWTILLLYLYIDETDKAAHFPHSFSTLPLIYSSNISIPGPISIVKFFDADEVKLTTFMDDLLLFFYLQPITFQPLLQEIESKGFLLGNKININKSEALL